MVTLGFVSAILPDKNLGEVLGFAKQHDFDCVEVMCWPKGKAERRYAGVTHIDVENLTADEIERIHQLMLDTVEISALGYYPNALADDPDQCSHITDHIKKVIEAAGKLNIGRMNTFVGRDHTRNLEYNFDRFQEVWPEIIAVAEKAKVKIGIENCAMFFTQDEWPGGKNLAYCPANWDRMFELIPSDYFGLNYDPSHLVWQHMNHIMPIYDYAEKIFHVHIKDVKLYQHKLDKVGVMAVPLEYHAPKIPGLGDVRWGDFFSALSQIGYRGPACIEVEDRAYEGSEGDILASILQSKRYIKQFMP